METWTLTPDQRALLRAMLGLREYAAATQNTAPGTAILTAAQAKRCRMRVFNKGFGYTGASNA